MKFQWRVEWEENLKWVDYKIYFTTPDQCWEHKEMELIYQVPKGITVENKGIVFIHPKKEIEQRGGQVRCRLYSLELYSEQQGVLLIRGRKSESKGENYGGKLFVRLDDDEHYYLLEQRKGEISGEKKQRDITYGDQEGMGWVELHFLDQQGSPIKQPQRLYGAVGEQYRLPNFCCIQQKEGQCNEVEGSLVGFFRQDGEEVHYFFAEIKKS